MKQEYREAFSEVNEIFKLMPKELVNRIPKKFREMIEEEKEETYYPNIQEPLEEQKLKNETIIILGLIYRDFLCDENERRKLQEKDAKELAEVEQEIEKEMRQKYNPDEIFKRKSHTRDVKGQEIETHMILKEEKWYKKIFNIIKRIFGT